MSKGNTITEKQYNEKVVGVLEMVKKQLEELKVPPSYNTGKVKGMTNVYYVGTPGDSYSKGLQRATGRVQSILKIAKEKIKL